MAKRPLNRKDKRAEHEAFEAREREKEEEKKKKKKAVDSEEGDEASDGNAEGTREKRNNPSSQHPC